MKRSPLAGNNDYTAAPLDAVLEHLKEIQQLTDGDVTTLRQLCAILQAENKGCSPDQGDDQREQFANYCLEHIERAAEELTRLLHELPLGVRKSHARAIRALHDASYARQKLCLSFKKDCCRIFNPTADEIYKTVMSHTIDFQDLSSMASRLNALVGASIQRTTNTNPQQKLAGIKSNASPRGEPILANPHEIIAKKLMDEHNITRPSAKQIVICMARLGANSEKNAKPEHLILNKAKGKSRITSVFSDGSVKNERYVKFRKRYIKNTGNRKGRYYLDLT